MARRFTCTSQTTNEIAQEIRKQESLVRADEDSQPPLLQQQDEQPMEEEEEEKQPQQEVELENEPSEAPLPTCQPSTSSVMDDPTAAGIKVPFNQFLFLDAFF